MKQILRVYVQKNGKEECVNDPEQIVKLISTTTDELDLDYDAGQRVKMGTSRDLIGETVKVGEYEIQVPQH